jgi:hypothetical protein
MRTTISLLLVGVLGLALTLGCNKAAPGADERADQKARERQAGHQAANYDVFKDPAIRKVAQENPQFAEKYKAELEKAELPGTEPVAALPAAATTAVSAESATSATSAAATAESAATAASAAPATTATTATTVESAATAAPAATTESAAAPAATDAAK